MDKFRFFEIKWCGRRDLNPHGLRHQNLNLACLPISSRPHERIGTRHLGKHDLPVNLAADPTSSDTQYVTKTQVFTPFPPEKP